MSLTLPDGRVEEFDLQLSPTSGIGVITSTRVTGFAPRQGTQGTLEGLDNPDLLLVNAGFEDELVDDGTLELYDPKLFRYTTLDGTKIEIHRSDGVRKITDRNGIAITFGPSGITHSAGPSVVFTRDAQGRITSVTDLNGNAQTYAYDGNGDLVSHIDPPAASRVTLTTGTTASRHPHRAGNTGDAQRVRRWRQARLDDRCRRQAGHVRAQRDG